MSSDKQQAKSIVDIMLDFSEKSIFAEKCVYKKVNREHLVLARVSVSLGASVCFLAIFNLIGIENPSYSMFISMFLFSFALPFFVASAVYVEIHQLHGGYYYKHYAEILESNLVRRFGIIPWFMIFGGIAIIIFDYSFLIGICFIISTIVAIIMFMVLYYKLAKVIYSSEHIHEDSL